MTRFSFFLGVCFALLLMTGCSDSKGPGALGSKEDIVIRNNGLPGAAQQNAGDFSSTIEQAQAMPAPEVAEPESLPPPAMDNPAAPVPVDPEPTPVEKQETVSAADIPTPSPQVSAPIPAVPPPPVPADIDVNDPAVILAAQTAMRASGVYSGKIDGEINTGFLNALSNYQAKNGLPQGGLNSETLRHLRIIP